jgi:hypothetical protein
LAETELTNSHKAAELTSKRNPPPEPPGHP